MSRVERVDMLLRQIEHETKVAFDEHSELLSQNARLKAENAKLRELCADMMWTIRHAHGYFKNDTHELLMTYERGRDGKPTHVAYSLTDDEEMYEKRMRELGIEADEC